MPLVEWHEEFCTGIDPVDYEHWELVDLINRLFESLGGSDERAAVSGFLGDLHDAVAAHFALEEKLMVESRYRGYTEHKADHERLLDELRDIMEAHEAGAFANCADYLAERLEVWFMRHFHTLDMQLHRTLGA
jgi:hemerythrin-like metal-binding protein